VVLIVWDLLLPMQSVPISTKYGDFESRSGEVGVFFPGAPVSSTNKN
jgi:hypothetical protein